MYLLDTDIIVWHLRNRKEVVALVTHLSETGRLSISALTRLEVGIGMKESEREATGEFLNSIETYEVDAAIADMAAEFVRYYQAKGITLDIVDTVIAATSVTYGLTLVTLNVKHYPMPEVRLHSARVRRR